VKVALLGYRGKVGTMLVPALEAAGHDVVGIEWDDPLDVSGCDAAVDFTRPDTVFRNATDCIGQGVPPVIGTTGLSEAQVAEIDRLARDRGVPAFIAPNFAIGAVLMMRFAEEAVRWLPKAEIIELHHDTKLDAPSGTSKATAARMGGEIPIHSVRLPGLLAHQEVLLGGPGQLLTIRHDSLSHVSFAPGVLLALEKVRALPPGLTVGLDALLEE